MSMQGESGSSRPVFVDPSGRRGRTVRRIMWAAGGLCGLYAVLVVVALLLPVGLNRLVIPGLGPLLPGPVAPALADAGPDSRSPSSLLTPSGAPSTRSASDDEDASGGGAAPQARTIATTDRTTAEATARPRATASARPTRSASPTAPATATPSPAATTTPSPSGTPSATPSARPGASGTAPGHSGDRGGGKPTAKPQPAATKTPHPHPTKG
ncbi:hypothetical protein [Cellulomonas edaphi]|uniref:Uncharacterized protein n=1 Tax=Cellulomonas edaphi TaxID=3053468 RepID=A0ABT7SA90_9CELL|nr:hypothetical protein [Cellulomons edaphi]MDM7832491.1 hypothetical protein [Cellulomons edaphi]